MINSLFRYPSLEEEIPFYLDPGISLIEASLIGAGLSTLFFNLVNLVA